MLGPSAARPRPPALAPVGSASVVLRLLALVELRLHLVELLLRLVGELLGAIEKTHQPSSVPSVGEPRGSEPGDTSATEITVEVMAVRWRADDGDFAVLAALTDEGDEVTVTGPLGHVHEGESVDVGGGFRHHAQHGWQFHAERVRVREPVGDAALLAYLGAVKHVGPAGARWLLDRHGPEVLGVIDRDPGGRLREVPGIGPRRIRAAVKSWEDQGALRAVRLFLESHGVPAAVAARVYRAYGPGTIELLQADPYAMTELDGIGFATADALAVALGTPPDSPGRLDAGVLHALREAELDGHCHLPREELCGRAPAPARRRGRRPHRRAGRRRAGSWSTRTASPTRAWTRIERRLARNVRALLDDGPALRLDRDPDRRRLGCVRTDRRPVGGRRAGARQPAVGADRRPRRRQERVDARAGGRAARRSRGPCGCARPTGKAARRLGELTGAEATTIHRLLEYVPGEGFARDADQPIEGADVLVVDEASMLSVRLADALIAAVGPRTHVLLVGDVDQLAPVGAGPGPRRPPRLRRRPGGAPDRDLPPGRAIA